MIRTNTIAWFGQTAGMDDENGPRYLRLDDGRLLTWFYAEPNRVSGFQLTFDEWVGTQPIPDEVGLELLAEHCRQRDSRLLGPLSEPPLSALRRRSRGRRGR